DYYCQVWDSSSKWIF
nr:immunoglobulin light chain junction region [Macaca mulatta]MOV65868.1 immunoglobulin light chain junction region [Macaca mulatta]MOV65872.1 immunoglobulin light chain junction region [Macaca mulatta]MOV65876.1 immunoglobulin light chain junction region [Macaca mulatta]MOV65899.1 immunoglobulin light chain junction region [Macaca mulatta]